MRDEQVEKIARALADQLTSGREATLRTPDYETRDRILARLRANLAGRSLEEPPD